VAPRGRVARRRAEPAALAVREGRAFVKLPLALVVVVLSDLVQTVHAAPFVMDPELVFVWTPDLPCPWLQLRPCPLPAVQLVPSHTLVPQAYTQYKDQGARSTASPASVASECLRLGDLATLDHVLTA